MLDDEINQLEARLGLSKDQKKRSKYMKKVENEGLGLGFLDFLDDIEVKAKKDKSEYQKPKGDYKFNMNEFEVALGESDLSNGVEQDQDQDEVDDYDDEEGELESNEDQAGLSDESYYQDQDDAESVEAIIPAKKRADDGDDDQSLSESEIEDDLNPG